MYMGFLFLLYFVSPKKENRKINLFKSWGKSDVPGDIVDSTPLREKGLKVTFENIDGLCCQHMVQHSGCSDIHLFFPPHRSNPVLIVETNRYPLIGFVAAIQQPAVGSTSRAIAAGTRQNAVGMSTETLGSNKRPASDSQSAWLRDRGETNVLAKKMANAYHNEFSLLEHMARVLS